MRVHLDEIGPDGFDLDEPVTKEWLQATLGPGTPFRSVKDGHLSAHLERLDEHVVHARGRIALELSADCSRCLGETTLGLNTRFQVTLFPAGKEPPPGPDGEIDPDDMGISTYADKEVDLSQIVNDEVFLQLPMNPLCSESCAGLCPNCGKNLNEGACQCAPRADLRWEALRQLKVD
ncbi:MAG: hypothetical protein A2289_14620 [Deltaproteobacteria bacterium RIFOXYA12_FULL_58_15]|nr:MAG: hypothetical protein A2289_14620 [Deltaproteobacteria bacterium RIFOXYA12_FULL_58_15]OGR08209.1 MAG: hypothetical protein A2341_20020 [Deltaproteobacteria bacterium RIFOXYB12_FULL_58_9]